MHITSSDESTISLGDLTSDPFSSLGSSATFIISSIDISSTGFSGSRLWVRGAGCGFLAISFSISSTDIDSSGFSLKKKKTMQRCRGESKRFLFITSVEQDLPKKPIGHSLVASSPCFKARLSAKILITNFALSLVLKASVLENSGNGLVEDSPHWVSRARKNPRPVI